MYTYTLSHIYNNGLTCCSIFLYCLNIYTALKVPEQLTYSHSRKMFKNIHPCGGLNSENINSIINQILHFLFLMLKTVVWTCFININVRLMWGRKLLKHNYNLLTLSIFVYWEPKDNKLPFVL